MSVTAQDVDRVAELANLELSSAEKSAMLRDLNSVLGYFAKLNELDTATVSATVPALEQVARHREPTLRADELVPSLSRESVLASAPDTDGVFFKVPKVIER